MNYKVLYRKYRPSNFDELIGQDSIVTILKNSIIDDKIAHAYIFTGPRGTGKTSTAKLFAKALNCPNAKKGIPCEKCENCINYSSSPDIIELDAASNNGVEYIREIKDNVLIAPSISKYKIYIIDEVHMLSNAAWNAFLKTLEEPPSNVIFILATTEIQKVPVTVLSRCQRFDFARIDRELIKKHVKDICDKEKIKYDDEALTEISYLSDGCMRDALSILDQISKVSNKIDIDTIKNNYGTISNDDIEKIYYDILHNDLDSLITDISNVKESGIDIKILLNKMIEDYIEKAIEMKKKNLSTLSFNHIKEIIKILNEMLTNINITTNGYLMLELNLLSFINSEDNNLSSREIDQIISREIISDKKVDVNNLINTKNSYYKLDDEFIDIRINNSFVKASKDIKKDAIEDWKKFVDNNKSNLEIYNSIKDVSIMVASPTNLLLVCEKEAIKMINNSKLDVIENNFNNMFNKDYKMIFITKKEWDKYLKSFDKDKKYKYIKDDKYINNNDSKSLAEDLFGDDVVVE